MARESSPCKQVCAYHERIMKDEEIREQEREDKERHKIIEEERMRILQQNIEKLVGHIPKGVLSEVRSTVKHFSNFET